jgi:hypothetical protein
VRPEPVEVALIDERPGRFVWRGRLYTVLAVLERPSRGDEAMRCWKVTAAPGRNVPAAAFGLCVEVASGRWLLTRDGD